jgi:Ca2+-binding RTX toxin-like protein
MSIFFGSNGADIITPDFVSSTVLVAGFPKKPSNAVDNIYAGGGDDIVAAGGGNDFALLGTGDDVFIWNPGDGSDFVDGEADSDTLIFNGAAVSETMTISADGAAAKLLRDVASVTMTLVRLETIDIAALGGADTIIVNDLLGTAVSRVNVDLAGTLNGTAGDGIVDTVIVNATDGDDIILLSLQGGALVVDGLAARIVVENFDAGSDLIVIRGLGGDDIIDASAVGAGAPLLTLDGGTGSNTIIQPPGTTDPDFVLTAIGSDGDDTLTISRNAAGQLFVNGVAQAGKTIANTALIRAYGLNGNDTITLDQSNGALPAAELYGGNGNDTLTGGAGGDTLFGGADNDNLRGQGGNDLLFGGAGNDVLTGGDADDQVFGEGGDDRMIWNPGDDTDLFEGGDGTDTAEVNGGGGAEQFTVTANGARVRFDRVNPAPFALDIGTTERLVVEMNGGDDSFSATGNLAALIQITVDGGAGNDTILGSNGIDTLLGGDGDDFIDGQQGNDVAFLGAGTDVFQWDPGDGSDVVEGQDGTDTLLFNGSAGNEAMAVSANGGRALFTRNLGNIVMDLDGIEVITANALGGTDTVTVNDLSGTDVTQVNVNLAGTIGGTAGDGAADVVTGTGTNGNDVIDVFGAGTSVAVLGLSARIDITNSEGANDSLVINGLGGDDGITATTLPVGVIRLTLDGGAGNDTILGSQGADVILGGDGDDFAFGDNGNDVAFLGAGNDVFQWDPGDGNDTIEGQGGTDTMLFFGSNASENIDIVANGGRVLFLRNVANVTMDLDDVERIEFRALGGADNIVVGDLSGTDITRVDLDLRGSVGGGDGSADTVTVNATNGADVIEVASSGDVVTVSGPTANVTLFSAEGANDRLTLNGLGGDDVINASGLAAGIVQLTMNGGLGADVLIGSQGNDLINGGDGNDTALMGGGDDTFVWNPGDDNDTLEGQSGTDTMLFNGANVAEIITFTANGGRVLFTRNVANVIMDLNDVETIDFNALGGADSIVVNDLSGTDVTDANINLAGTPGGAAGDGVADVVTVNGRSGTDTIDIVGSGTSVSVVGAAAAVDVTNVDAGIDRVEVNGQGGDDTITATTLAAGIVGLTIDGGAGNDTIRGSQGADTVLGGDGDDFVFGDNGNDVALMGAGDDIFQWDPGDGNDIVEGQAGTDTLLFFGSNASENINISANGGRVTFFRDVANVTMDLNDVERIDYRALGGADNIVLGDLSGTDMTQVNLDLRGSGGGGDGAADTVTVNATNGDDVFGVSSSGGVVTVFGLAAQVNLTSAEGANDRLTLNGQGGDDVINATSLAAGIVQLTMNGGLGDDIFIVSAGNDLINGGDGDDVALMGAGDDIFVWNPGDDNDTLEGQSGTDTMLFNGANVAEIITFSANGGRVLFTRNVATVIMDLNDVEDITYNALGGADNIVVNDLSGTDVTEVNLNLAASGGGGDGQADTITIFGTLSDDVILVVGDGGGVTVLGLAAQINITGFEASLDRLIIQAVGGDDVIEASGVASGAILLTLDGGNGNDVLVGGDGNDNLLGGDGDDVLLGGPGVDTLNGGPGDDVEIQ